jgi:CBS domain-containing protein
MSDPFTDGLPRAATQRCKFTVGSPRRRKFLCITNRRGCILDFLLQRMDVGGNISGILGQKIGEIYSISPDATVFEAIQMMDNKNVGALLVMEGARLVGVISERDYTRKVFLRGKRSRETTVAEIMSTDVFTTRPQEGVEECLRLMTEKHIRHLPVVDGEKVIGVISIGDLVKHVISCQSATIAHLENYISGGYTG